MQESSQTFSSSSKRVADKDAEKEGDVYVPGGFNCFDVIVKLKS